MTPRPDEVAQIAAKLTKAETYSVDDQGLFCRHCGRARWLHRYVRLVGFVCTPQGPQHLTLDQENG